MKVVQFQKKLTAEQQQVQDEILMLLNNYIARAKRGEYVALGLCAVCADGTIDHAHASTTHFSALLGAVARLEYRLNVSVDSDTIPINKEEMIRENDEEKSDEQVSAAPSGDTEPAEG